MCRMCAHLQTKCAHAEKISVWDTYTPNVPNIDQGQYGHFWKGFLSSSGRFRAADLQTKWAHVEKSSPSGLTLNILRHNVKTRLVGNDLWRTILDQMYCVVSFLTLTKPPYRSVEGHQRKARVTTCSLVLHNLHFFDICREISRWQVPWRPPLAYQRRCWRGWLEIHCPVWKECPGITSFLG